MTARILIVDDLLSNVRLLEARLTAEYFDVMTAYNGWDALTVCQRESCDLVLLDVMMPGMDGFETCRRLKADSATSHIPVVMVTALDQPTDRVRGLEAGADDFLTKPLDEVALVARVKSLTRMKVMLDELRSRTSATALAGLGQAVPSPHESGGLDGHVLLVEDRPGAVDRIGGFLSPVHRLENEPDPQRALFRAAEGDYDLCIISLGLNGHDGLRLASQLRSLERTRHLPILMLAEAEDRNRILRGLDIGVNDYLVRPIDRNELLARVRTQVRRKRYADSLRNIVYSSIEMAMVDSLTGLNNRRYLDGQLKTLVSTAAGRNRHLSVMLLDLDHFKLVNDTYGHDAGDEVLKAFAARVKNVTRTGDIVCRLGGEEFIIVLPDTRLDIAEQIAERVRTAVVRTHFSIENGARLIPVTVSIGIADRGRDTEPHGLFKRADLALYRSKHEGRNKVSAQAA